MTMLVEPKKAFGRCIGVKARICWALLSKPGVEPRSKEPLRVWRGRPRPGAATAVALQRAAAQRAAAGAEPAVRHQALLDSIQPQ